jgi:putative ABC transport system permease protein
MKLLRRIRSVVSRRAAERDLDDEIALHLRLEAEQLEQQGLDARTAAATARRRFGRIESIKDALRAVRGVEPFEELRRDLVFAARALRRRPGFATVVLLTLVIGLASATTIFGVVYGVLWAPLPYGDPDRLVTVWQTDHPHGIDRGRASLPNVLDWRERSRSFAALAAIEPFGVRYSTPEGPERLFAWRVTEGFFTALRATPLLGRTFAPDEYQPGHDGVAVLDYDLWRTRFNADSGLIGKILTLNDGPVRVIGVMPRGVRYPRGQGIWLPKVPQPAELLERNANFYLAVGRLAPGVSLDRARRDMTGVAAGLAREYPAVDGDVSVSLVPMRDDLVGNVRGRLLLVFASVGLLVLLTGANLTTMLMARAVEREGELRIRAALGAGRRRIALQVMTEHLLLGALGWGLSIIVAIFALRTVRAMGAGLLPRADELHVGLPAAVFAALLVLGFALTPARTSRKGRRVQQVLVVSEVSLALVLVIAAGLFVRSVRALLGVDPGFAPANVLAVSLQTEHLYPSDTARAAFVRTLEDRLSTIPGVRQAGVTSGLPFAGTIGTDRAAFEIVGRPVASVRERPNVHAAAVSPGYFPALGIPMRQGRAFVATDDATHPPVAIVSAAFAREYWGTANPIGERLSASFGREPVVREIVGVVADVHQTGLDQPPAPDLYLPYAQEPGGGVEFVLHTSVTPRSLLGAVRRELGNVNGAMPIATVATLDELLAESTRASRVVLTVLGAFASIALTLAGLGIFGVMTHLTRSRTKEVSIRLALGASSRGILNLILGEALGLAAAGTLIGLAAAAVLGRSVSALLYSVSPIDPLTLAAGVTVLLAVASIAAYVPARRAATVDAVRALRD